MPNVVLNGDSGSHGGSVTASQSNLTDGGTSVCLLGDSYECPVHGSNPINGGCSSTLTESGIEVALNGATTECGATITASGTITND